MTVKELKQKLELLPADLPVCVRDSVDVDEPSHWEVEVGLSMSGEYVTEQGQIVEGDHFILAY